jgi:hypothetical protein
MALRCWRGVEEGILALLDCISLPGVWRISLADNNIPSFDTPFNRTAHSTRFRIYDRQQNDIQMITKTKTSSLSKALQIFLAKGPGKSAQWNTASITTPGKTKGANQRMISLLG